MWGWIGFAALNWLGVVYLKERGPDVLKPAPASNRMSPANILILAMVAAGLYGAFKGSLKWIKKKV